MGVFLVVTGSFIIGAIITGLIVTVTKPVDKNVTESYIDECIKILAAYKNGYKIEYMLLDGSEGCKWREIDTPSFNFGVASYRIKEEKKVDKYI